MPKALSTEENNKSYKKLSIPHRQMEERILDLEDTARKLWISHNILRQDHDQLRIEHDALRSEFDAHKSHPIPE